jgi:bifunctional DNA primase/polymerase-like protein
MDGVHRLSKPHANAEILAVALRLSGVGLCVLPAIPREKRPAVQTWKRYQQNPPTPDQLTVLFNPKTDGICLVTGAASGNLEMIDFDHDGVAFDAWCKIVQESAPELLQELVVEQSPSGGRHVVYRCEQLVDGNMKLAQREVDGKLTTLIETRGEGGLFLCAPTRGYRLIQGSFSKIPVISTEQRELLLEAAWSLNETIQPTVENREIAPISTPASQRPGDDFNARGDVVALLKKHGWQSGSVRGDGNHHWSRPSKTNGTSATLKDGTFYVFSSNAHPFEPNCSYPPFAVFAMLEHGGDYEAAARELGRQGYGGQAPTDEDVDLSGILVSCTVPKPSLVPTDPGPVSESLLRIPGFVGELMDHCLETAPYPNPTLAFCGAISLQATLAGRKVRDPGDNRTNLYLLGLAHSAAGKDWPRKINTRLLHSIGWASRVGDRFASGEGLQDALYATPAMLFQTDEFDTLLQSIRQSRDGRHEQLMGTLLTMYSSSSSVYPKRRKAGKKQPGVIDQPCLVIFGTAIPNHYYAALDERTLTNGLFARMLVLECGPRGRGQDPSVTDLPERIVETAAWWRDFQPGKGNLSDTHPKPSVVDQTDQARQVLAEVRAAADDRYDECQAAGDAMGTTVWGRVGEQTRKLALLYAVSENHREPHIDQAAAEWAVELVMHLTRRMLFMAAAHAADNPFHADCLRLLEKLRESPDHTLPHSMLLKRMKRDARTFRELIGTLAEQGDIESISVKTDGRPGVLYRLKSGVNEG